MLEGVNNTRYNRTGFKLIDGRIVVKSEKEISYIQTMEIIKLFFGVVLLAIFGWLLVRNHNRKGIIHSLFHLDTILGIIAGLYLVVTGLGSIL